jgi:hypothetical protein
MRNPDQIYYLYIKETNQLFYNSLQSQWWIQHSHSRFIPSIHKYYRLFNDDKNQFVKHIEIEDAVFSRNLFKRN